MKFSVFVALSLAGGVVAQGDLAALLQSQSDLSTLLSAVASIPGLNQTLSGASNVTILAPTNSAFSSLPADSAESIAIAQNNTAAIAALLSRHVVKGYYDSSAFTNVPVFAQTLLNSTTFTNTTGGEYAGFVKNGQDVDVLSGALTVSRVTQADIKLGNGIVIHKVDQVLRFGLPVSQYASRGNLTAFASAISTANLVSTLNTAPDTTIFIPSNDAFNLIGSVVSSVNVTTLASVLRYHVISNNIVFSPSLGNVSLPSLLGSNLTFTVTPDGAAFVNNAKIIFPNVILNNGVAHIIDNVLDPLVPFNSSSLNPSAPAASRVAYPSATPSPTLAFPSAPVNPVTTTVTTPSVLATASAVKTGASGTASSQTGAAVAVQTRAAGAMAAGVVVVAGALLL